MICSNILLKEDTEDESKEVNENVIEENLVGIEPLNGGRALKLTKPTNGFIDAIPAIQKQNFNL